MSPEPEREFSTPHLDGGPTVREGSEDFARRQYLGSTGTSSNSNLRDPDHGLNSSRTDHHTLQDRPILNRKKQENKDISTDICVCMAKKISTTITMCLMWALPNSPTEVVHTNQSMNYLQLFTKLEPANLCYF